MPAVIEGLVPVLMFCNASPLFRHTRVLFRSDAGFAAAVAALAVSSGYIGNLCGIHAPKRVKSGPEREATAILLNMAIVLGIATGSAVSYFLAQTL